MADDFIVGRSKGGYRFKVTYEWDWCRTVELEGIAPGADLAASAAHYALPEDAPVVPPDKLTVEIIRGGE